jgi:putative flippase GtrA
MLSGGAMILLDRLKSRFPRLFAVLDARAVLVRKAVSFALIGVVNSLVDAGLFFLALGYLTSHETPIQLLSVVANACHCGSAVTVTQVAANLFSWFIAVSGSYVMNSYITFAVESGRKLTLRTWATFVASGIPSVIANTTTLVVVAQFLPLWAAKGCAILVSFAVNFSLSHFVVFRARDGHKALPDGAAEAAVVKRPSA